MSSSEWTQLILAVLCAVGASLLVAVETALSIMTKSRAERMVESGDRGAERIALIAQDPAPSINAVLFTRLLLETSSIVLVTIMLFQHFAHHQAQGGLVFDQQNALRSRAASLQRRALRFAGRGLGLLVVAG